MKFKYFEQKSAETDERLPVQTLHDAVQTNASSTHP